MEKKGVSSVFTAVASSLFLWPASKLMLQIYTYMGVTRESGFRWWEIGQLPTRWRWYPSRRDFCILMINEWLRLLYLQAHKRWWWKEGCSLFHTDSIVMYQLHVSHQSCHEKIPLYLFRIILKSDSNILCITAIHRVYPSCLINPIKIFYFRM